VWPAAPFLARFLARHWNRRDPLLHLPSQTRVRVLELGAGCGLVGLTAAQMDGCTEVVMTDHDPGTLKLIEEGVARNGPRLRAACRAVLLEWGKGEVVASLGVFDLVVGSDLIYSDTVVRPLMETVAAVLRLQTRKQARFVICGSFALGEVILAEVERVCADLRLVRAPVSLRELEGEDDDSAPPETVWMECLTLAE
jgi:predicted nicotinamide N-methyase